MARPTRTQDSAASAPRLRRAYYDCRYGQLHIHNAIPAGGGFDELTSVLCLPATGESGRVFTPLLKALGEARSVYALDPPGTGESDPAPGVAGTAATVHAVTDFVDSMRIRSFDLLARGDGCAAALQVLDERSAAVRRVLLLGAPAGTRGGAKVTLVAAEDAATLPGRVLELLAGPT